LYRFQAWIILENRTINRAGKSTHSQQSPLPKQMLPREFCQLRPLAPFWNDFGRPGDQPLVLLHPTYQWQPTEVAQKSTTKINHQFLLSF
jgi:hypothetical protein